MGRQVRSSIARHNIGITHGQSGQEAQVDVDLMIAEDESEVGNNEQQIVDMLNASGLVAATNRAPKDVIGNRQRSKRFRNVETQLAAKHAQAPADNANPTGDEQSVRPYPPIRPPRNELLDAELPASVNQKHVSRHSVAPVNRLKRKHQVSGNTHEKHLRPQRSSLDDGHNEVDGEIEEPAHKLTKRSRENRKAKNPSPYGKKKSNGHGARIIDHVQTRSQEVADCTEPDSEQPRNYAGEIEVASQHSASTEKSVERHSSEESFAGAANEIIEIHSKPILIQVIIPPFKMTRSTTAIDESQFKNGSEEDPSRLDSPGDLIKSKVLKEMFDSVRHVGCKHDIRADIWYQKLKFKNPCSVLGKRILRRLERLIKAYSDMRDSKAAGNDNAVKLAHIKASESIELLQEQAKFVSNRLGNPSLGITNSGKNPPDVILTDIYFHLLPKFLEALKIGVDAHAPQESMGNELIKEFVDLLDLIRDMAEAAVGQPKGSQPYAPKDYPYQVVQPIRHMLPIVRNLRAELQAALKTRMRSEQLSDWNRGAAERDRTRLEETQKQYVERRRRNNEIHRLQREVLDAKLNDPVWGHFLKVEIEIQEAKTSAREAEDMAMKREAERTKIRNLRLAELSTVQDFSDEDIELDPFDNDGWERVRIFGKNNKKDSSPRIWSEEEKSIFIDAMRFEQGHHRYYKVAEKLERSPDEIFAKAKDLQEAMDDARELGQLNLPCDKWTESIWVERK